MIPTGPGGVEMLVHGMRAIYPLNTSRIMAYAHISQFEIGDKGDPENVIKKSAIEFQGIFDTGASRTTIFEKSAQRLKLKPMGRQIVYTANGEAEQERYAVNIILPNKIMFIKRMVTAAKLHDIDFLLGMDIIGLGDFTITERKGLKVVEFNIYNRIS